MGDERVTIARIGAPHGVRGEVRLKSFAETPSDVNAYGPLAGPDGRAFVITALRPASGKSPDMFVVRFEGIGDRDAAAALNGLELTIARDRLPAPDEDEFYHADLIGLEAMLPNGEPLGTIVGVDNYGAGDLLEIALKGGPQTLVPFTREVVPEVDLAAGRVVVDPPPGLLEEVEEPEEPEKDGQA